LFNALLSVESIYYYPNLEGAFLESFRILNPTGRAYFLINYYKENVHSHEWAKHLDIPLHLLGTKDYIGLLTLAGFRSVTDRRIVDTTPVPEDWKPTRWFPTLQDLTRFRAEGALLLTAEK
jgi:hypothetical protein